MAKKSSSAVRFGKNLIAAPCGVERTMIVDQPTENDVHAGEAVVVVDNPSTTPSTSVDNEAAADARRESNLESDESTISPYAYSPVAIDFGPGLATYWVPKHLLRSPKWSTTDPGGTICLPGVTASTGHTLVHYLYTGTYQALEAKREDAATPTHIKFKQALSTFVLASAYELQDLERLAKEQIEIYGSRMALSEVFDTVREEFPEWAWFWLHEYLLARVEKQFDLDYAFFTSEAYIRSVGDGELHKFITYHLLEMFSEKLTHALKRQERHCLNDEKPHEVLHKVGAAAIQTHCCSHHHGGHQTGTWTESDEMSFELPHASCEDVDDVISLENISDPDCAFSESQIDGISYPKVSEDQSMVKSDPTRVYEEPHEPKHAIEVEKRDFPAPEPISGEPVPREFDEPRLSRILDGGDESGNSGKKSKKSKERSKRELAEEKPLKKGDEDRLPKEAEEEAERKREEEENAAAANNAANNSSWTDITLANDDWGSMAATEIIGKKKKKISKKGKAEPISSPPPSPPAEPATTFDDIKLDDVNLDDAAPKIEDTILELEPTPAPKLEKMEEDLRSYTVGNATKDKKGKKKGAVEEEPPPEPEPQTYPKLVFEWGPAKPTDSWGFAAPATSKKVKKGKGKKFIEELKIEEPTPPPPDPEPLVETEPTPPAEDKTVDGWNDEGPLAVPTKKSKKSKKGAAVLIPESTKEELVPELEPEFTEPVPEIEPEQVKEENNGGGDLVLSSIWDGSKKKKKGKAAKPEPLPEPEPDFAMPLAMEAALQEPDVVGESKAEEEDDWGAPSWGKKKKDLKKGAQVEVVDDTTTPVQKPDEDDPWGSTAFNIGKKSKKKKRSPENRERQERTGKEEGELDVQEAEEGAGAEAEAACNAVEAEAAYIAEETEAAQVAEEEPEPIAGPVPAAEQEAFPGLEQEYKPKPGSTLEKSILEASSTFCPRPSYHLLGSDGWKTCEPCRAMLRGIAVHLAKENMTVLL